MTKEEKRQWREFREWKQVHDYEKKTKKPPALRGSRRVHDKQTGEWSYAPRSGFASGFLQLFSLFLMIVVLWNVVSGAGYTTYKSAVGFLYATTESIGSSTQALLTGLMSFASLFNPLITGVYDLLFNHAKANEALNTDIQGGYFDGVRIYNCKYTYTDSQYTVVCVDLITGSFMGYETTGRRVVYESNHPYFKVGDEVKTRWFFGYRLINVKSNYKWRGLKEFRQFGAFDEE